VKRREILDEVQKLIGYRFKDPTLLRCALTHASSTETRIKSNERLEFLGDAILGMIVCEELYRQFPDCLEGDLTKIKSAVVSRRTCAKIARAMGLHRFLVLGKGMTSRSGLPPSVAAAAYESLIGAIYVDSGSLETVRRFVLKTTAEHIREAAASEHQHNYKSQLQQYAQKVLGTTPVYAMLDEKGPDHSKCFEVAVLIGSRRYAGAWGSSKKEAEQKAAYLTLRELGVIPASPEFEADMQSA